MQYIRFPARFLRRLTALLLALSVCLCLVPAASASDWSGVLNADRLIPAMVDFFKGTEGSYGSVNPNDSGALSVGILQWHGVRALNLVRRILKAAPDAIWTLPAALRAEVRNANASWGSRTLTAAEAAALSGLLASPAGVSAQDAQAREDLTGYIDLAWSAGMRSDAAALYWASILNQFGTGGAQTYLRHIRRTLGADETCTFESLDALHAAVRSTMTYGQRYLANRERAYAYIAALGWCLTGRDAPEPPAPDGPRFTDLPPQGRWDREAIDWALDRGLLVGVSPTRFAPEDGLNRAELVTILWRLAEEPEPAGEAAFVDVPAGKWYTVPVAWAAQTGVVRGTSATRFSPFAPVTREQFAALLYRFDRWRTGSESPEEESAAPAVESAASDDEEAARPAEDAAPPSSAEPCELPVALLHFSDAETVSPYARAAMAWAVETDLLRGEPHGDDLRLHPKKPATRSQAAALLMRYCVCFGTGD